MPLDQATRNTVTNLAKAFLAWAGEEAQEGHHPPNQMQHQQALGGGDVNEPAQYPTQNTQGAGGMLLLAPDGRALFVRRAANARDHAGAWSIPGGMTEGDELPWQTALRETREEVGDIGNPEMQLLDHNIMDNVGFTTFGGKVNDNFRPTLNEEHDGFQWALPQDAPQPLHPGLKATLGFATDPLTEKGSKIMSSMKEQYGPEKGERVFYASKNKGTISGVDSYNTTGRQDTQIPRPVPVNPHIESPFNANVDGLRFAEHLPRENMSPSQFDQMVTQPNSSAPPMARRSTNDAWRSPSQVLDAWKSPPQDGNTTAIKSLKPAASKPVAATAGSRQLTPNRYMKRSHDVVGGVTPPTQRGANDLSRFVLRDTATDTEYAIDQPLPAEYHPIADGKGWASPTQDEVTEDAGGGAGGWGHQGLVPPTQGGANDLGGDPMQAPAGEGGGMAPPAVPTGGRMMGGTSQGMPGNSIGMNAGPKLTHSYKMQYPDGSVDERKITRPGGPQMGQSPMDNAQQQFGQQQWASPPQDRGWPNAGTLGPSAKGGSAFRSGGGGGGARM